MKTYTVLFAEDVPHYGVAEIEAENDAAALEAARAFDISDVTNDAERENSACKRVVSIKDPEGNSVVEDVALDDCFLRYGGEKDRLLCDAAQDMLDALVTAEQQLSEYCINDDGRDSDAHEALAKIRAAIAKARGGHQ